MLIDTSDIAVIDRQRKTMDPKKLNELAESINARGKLIHPIVVRYPRPEDRNPDGSPVKEPFVLVVGGRRLAAHLQLKRDKIEARIFEKLSPLEQEIIELEENLVREDIPWKDAVEAKTRIHELRKKQNPFQTLEQTAAEIGEHFGNLSKDIKLSAAMKHNPGLANAPTKRAALREIDHKMEIASRILRIADTDVEDIKKKIFTADARDFVRQLPDKSVDMYLTDLPYGIGYKSASETGAKSLVLGQYDDSPEIIRDLVADLVPQMARTIRPSGWIVLFYSSDGMPWLRSLFRDACSIHGDYRNTDKGLDGEGSSIICATAYKQPKGEREECRFMIPELLDWIWHRPNSRNISQWPERHAKHVYESILVINGGDARLTQLHVPDVLVYDAVYENRLHEMQKPHELCKELVNRCSIPGELVVDLCFGSGACLAAAADLGRDFKGCEINPDLLPTALAHVAGFYKPGVVKAGFAGKAGAEATRRELRLSPG